MTELEPQGRHICFCGALLVGQAICPDCARAMAQVLLKRRRANPYDYFPHAPRLPRSRPGASRQH